MNNQTLMGRAILRRDLAKKAAEKGEKAEKISDHLFGEPTPGGESMMLHTRQCPECQVGQTGPVAGKEGVWQCATCGQTYNVRDKGNIANQLPYDAKFYGGGPFLSAPSDVNYRNTASNKTKVVTADFRGSLSLFCLNVRDAITGSASAEKKKQIGEILSEAMKTGDLYGAIESTFGEQVVEVTEPEVAAVPAPVV